MEIKNLQDVPMNRVTLAFKGDLEQQYFRFYSDDTHRQIQIAVVLALVFGVVYEIMDAQLFPEMRRYESTYLHYFHYPLIGLCFFAARHERLRYHTQKIAMFIVALMGSGITALVHAAGSDIVLKGYYFHALLLSVSFGSSFCRLRFISSTAVSFYLLILYIVSSAVLSKSEAEKIQLFNNATDMALFIILGMLSSYLLEQYSRIGFVKSIIIENKQKEMLQLELSLEKERVKREIHDGISSELTGILAFAEKLKVGNDSSQHEKFLSQIERSARRGLQELRNIMLALGPEAMTLGYLSGYVQRFVSDLLSSQNIRVTVFRSDICESIVLSSEYVITFFRIVQESCQNILKHANAENVKISFSAEDVNMHIQIEDDGAGFQANSSSFGFGLENMRQRAQKAGGDCTISSTPTKGTCVHVTLPRKSPSL